MDTTANLTGWPSESNIHHTVHGRRCPLLPNVASLRLSRRSRAWPSRHCYITGKVKVVPVNDMKTYRGGGAEV